MSKKIKFSTFYLSLICIVLGVHNGSNPRNPPCLRLRFSPLSCMRQLEHFDIARVQHAHTVPCKVYRI